MMLLAVDTAAHLCSACLYDGAAERVCALRSENIGRGHAERLFPVIDAVLAESGRSLTDLDRLAVCIGPGSFTGIRVGVAALRGLALALDIPVIGVSVFDCMARMAEAESAVLVVLDARRDEVYAQLFSADRTPVDPPAVLPRDQAQKLAQRHGAAWYEPAAIDVAVLAALAASRDPGDEKPVPLYLRAPDAKPQGGFALPRRDAS